MTSRLETLPATASLADLLPIFERGRVAIIEEGGNFLGLITRVDLLNHLRRGMR
jgi:cystathionine beta-synthase